VRWSGGERVDPGQGQNVWILCCHTVMPKMWEGAAQSLRPSSQRGWKKLACPVSPGIEAELSCALFWWVTGDLRLECDTREGEAGREAGLEVQAGAWLAPDSLLY
jgi:hypothetical protein